MTDSAPTLLPRWASTVIVVMAGFGLSGLLWALVQQNRQLKATLSLQGPTAPAPPRLAAGDTLPAVGVNSEEGEAINLAELFNTEVGAIAFLTPTCPFCEDSIPAWNQLAVELRTAGIPFVGVMLGTGVEAATYKRRHSVAWPLWSITGSEATRLGVARVPTTAVFSRGGVVAQAWTGALRIDDVRVISSTAQRRP